LRFVAVADGTRPYDAGSFPIPRNGLELGQEKSPGHTGSYLKVSSLTDNRLFLVNMLHSSICCVLKLLNVVWCSQP